MIEEYTTEIQEWFSVIFIITYFVLLAYGIWQVW